MTNIPVIVVANKVDLVAAKNYVPPQQPRPSQHVNHHNHHHHHHHNHPHHAQNQHDAGNNLGVQPSLLHSSNGAVANGSAQVQGKVVL